MIKQSNVNTPVATLGGDYSARLGGLWEKQIGELKQKFGAGIQEVLMPGTYVTDVPIVFVEKSQIVPVLNDLKSTAGYSFLSDLTATDETPDELRFHVVYNLYAREQQSRIRIKVKVRENEKVPTIVSVWPGANWNEREVYDMFGVEFEGHPELRRILMDPRWEGHPLRKDYPLRGYQIFPTPYPPDPSLLDKEGVT